MSTLSRKESGSSERPPVTGDQYQVMIPSMRFLAIQQRENQRENHYREKSRASDLDQKCTFERIEIGSKLE